MVAAWAISLSLLTNVIDDQLEARLTNATGTLADGGFPFTAELIGRLDRLIEARIVLLDGDGSVGLSTGDTTIAEAFDGIALPDLNAETAAPAIMTIG